MLNSSMQYTIIRNKQTIYLYYERETMLFAIITINRQIDCQRNFEYFVDQTGRMELIILFLVLVPVKGGTSSVKYHFHEVTKAH